MSSFRSITRGLTTFPGFTVTAILTLALGISAATIVYSVVHAVLLKPLDYPEPAQLAVLYESRDGRTIGGSVSPVTFRDWQRETKTFATLAALRGQSVNLTGHGEPRRVVSTRATAGLWDIFRIAPLHGRVFTADEDQPGASAVAVISHAFWQQEFGGAPSALGQTLLLDQRPVTVIGILPPSFQPRSSTQLWVPMAFTPSEFADTNRGSHYVNVYGRLRAGVTLEQGRAEIISLSERIARDFPASNKLYSALVLPMHEVAVGGQRGALLTLLAAVAALLLIACVNVANLLLARATSRLREFSLRAALGASPSRIVRQLLGESLVLAGLGGGLGILLAYWGLDALLALAPRSLPRVPDATVNTPVLLVATAVTVLCGLGFGLVPAFQAARVNLVDALKEGARGTGEGASRGRFRRALVVTEIALALALLVVSGLLMRSFTRLVAADPGFDPRGVVALSLSLPAARYDTPEKLRAFADAAHDRLAAVPGVAHAGLIQSMPFSGSEWSFGVTTEANPTADDSESLPAVYYAIDADYFRAMGMPIVRGRAFTAADRDGAPRVAIVSHSLAQQLFPNQDPLGRRIHITNSREPVFREIVGVVRDVQQNALNEAPVPQVYEPFAQRSSATLHFVLRLASATPPPDLAAILKREIYALDKDQPVTRIAPLSELIAGTVTRQRWIATLLALFSGIAFLLAAIGIYGVVAYNVSQRTAEYGVRLALGALPRDILRLVLARTGRLIAAGLLAGLALALAAGRLLGSQLYQTKPYDPAVLAAIAALLTATALLASLLPALRATRVSPMTALRSE